MKLSRPIINQIRFDKELNLIGHRTGVNHRFECDGYCADGLDDIDQKAYMVGIRFRLSFYVGKLENEAAGYLSEAEATVLEFSTPIADLEMLTYFVKHMFSEIKTVLQQNLPILDLSYLIFPEPLKVANALLSCLTQLGLYVPKQT